MFVMTTLDWCIMPWRSILMYNNSTSAGTSLEVHQCLLPSRFISPLIPWGVSAPGGKMKKQLFRTITFLIIHRFLSLKVLLLIYSLFKKHCIQYISIWKIVLDLVKGTWYNNFMAGCGSLLWANTCSLWSGIKSWPGTGCLQRQVRRRWQ